MCPLLRVELTVEGQHSITAWASFVERCSVKRGVFLREVP